MADKAPDKQPPEGSNVPPLKIKVLFSRFSESSTSGSTTTASLSTAGLRPVAPPLPVKLDRGRAANDYSYLVPQRVHLHFGNTEQQHPAAAPSSVGPCPPICVGINTNRPPPVSCFGPKYTYRNAPSTMEYRHPHLQPVPNLQLVNMQPPGQRQTSPIVQPGRAVPVPSAPSVKKPEHQRIVKIMLSTQPGTQEAHQPHLLQPAGQKTADFKDEFQLPQDLLNTEQFPDTEKPIASIEPLSHQCLFPPIDSKQATQDSSFQKKTPTRLPRPLPQPLPKPLPSTLNRQQPTMLPKPSRSQSGSLPKPTSLYEWFIKSKPSNNYCNKRNFTMLI